MFRPVTVLKGIFAVNAMGMATYLIFARLYFAEAGLTIIQLGILFSVPGFILILSQPIWGIFTDYWGSEKANIKIMLIGSAVFLLLYYFAASFFLDHFVALLILIGILSLFYTAKEPTQNSLALSHLEGGEKRFGSIRLWGSIGWAICAVLLGYFLMEASLELIFPISAGLFLFTALIVSLLPSISRPTLERINVFRSDAVRKVFKTQGFLVFLFCLFLLGIGTSAAMNFLPIYLNEFFEFNLFTLGIFYALGAIIEVPFFFYGDWAMRSLGVKPFLITGFAVLSVSVLLFGLVNTPIMAFAIFPVRGLGFSFVYLGSVNYIDHKSPIKIRTLGQSMFTMVSFGIAAIVGCSTGGLIAQQFGFPFMYLAGGAIGLISVAILVLFWSV